LITRAVAKSGSKKNIEHSFRHFLPARVSSHLNPNQVNTCGEFLCPISFYFMFQLVLSKGNRRTQQGVTLKTLKCNGSISSAQYVYDDERPLASII